MVNTWIKTIHSRFLENVCARKRGKLECNKNYVCVLGEDQNSILFQLDCQ